MANTYYAMGSTPTLGNTPSIPSFNMAGGLPSSGGPQINVPNFNMPQGSPNFSNIQSMLAPPSTGLQPQYQQILDTINQQRDYYGAQARASAVSLAAQRGQTGSSMEQFGVNQADLSTNMASLNAIQQTLGQSAQAQTANTQLGAQLTSDEIASLRNLGLSEQSLGLQQQLGQQGLNIAQQNITSAQNIAQQQARNNLLMSGSSLLAPYLFGGGGGGGLFGGMGGGQGLFGGGGTGGMLGSGLGLFGGPGLGATGPNGLPIGVQGPGLPGAGAANGFMAGGMVPNIAAGGLGMVLGQNAFGANNMYSNAGGIAGGAGGSIFGPAGTAIGSFAGEGLGGAFGRQSPTTQAEILAAPITGGLAFAGAPVAKALGIGGGSGQSSFQSGQIGGKAAGDVDTGTLATTLGTSTGQIAYDSNQKGSFAAAYNAQLARLSPDELVKRYSTLTSPSNFQTPQDQGQAKAFKDATALNGGQPLSGNQFAWYLATYGSSKYGLA